MIQESSMYRQWSEGPDGQQCVRKIKSRALMVVVVILAVLVLPPVLFGLSSDQAEVDSGAQIKSALGSYAEHTEHIPLSVFAIFLYFIAVRCMWTVEENQVSSRLRNNSELLKEEAGNTDNSATSHSFFSVRGSMVVRSALSDWRFLSMNALLFVTYCVLYQPLQPVIETEKFVLSIYVKVLPGIIWMGFAVYFAIRLEKLRRFRLWLEEI